MAVPAHNGPLLTGAAVGVALTVTDTVFTVAGLQPLPVLLIVNEYVAVAVGVFVGFCTVEVKPLEPVHDHAVALVELALSVTVPPLHIVPLLVAPVVVGTGFTVTDVV